MAAFNRRNISDYRSTPEISPEEASNLLNDARDFIRIVESYLLTLGGD